ncbi:MAG: hypothetical protein Q9163_003408 [Psora crenata]
MGSYLFTRISVDGKDSRFDNIHQSAPKFFGALFAQATWVSLCLMPVLAVNSLPAALFASLSAAVTLTDVVGLLLYVGGSRVRHDGRQTKRRLGAGEEAEEARRGLPDPRSLVEISSPNHFDETTLWADIATRSASVLMSGPGHVGMGLAAYGIWGKIATGAMAALSPASVTFLLLKHDKRYGDRADYKMWKEKTPMFIPKL